MAGPNVWTLEKTPRRRATHSEWTTSQPHILTTYVHACMDKDTPWNNILPKSRDWFGHLQDVRSVSWSIRKSRLDVSWLVTLPKLRYTCCEVNHFSLSLSYMFVFTPISTHIFGAPSKMYRHMARGPGMLASSIWWLRLRYAATCWVHGTTWGLFG